MGINEYFGKNQKGQVEHFTLLAKGKNKEELREFERKMLKPEKLKPTTVKKPTETELDKRSVLMVFPDKASFDLFVKHFPIRTCGGNNLADMGGFMGVLNKMDEDEEFHKELGGCMSE